MIEAPWLIKGLDKIPIGYWLESTKPNMSCSHSAATASVSTAAAVTEQPLNQDNFWNLELLELSSPDLSSDSIGCVYVDIIFNIIYIYMSIYNIK